jgi:hypothetical protein
MVGIVGEKIPYAKNTIKVLLLALWSGAFLSINSSSLMEFVCEWTNSIPASQ